ncbi:uncharacterized protein [Aphelocoma coerulescens]|uniref:uncharacterized protein isoform X2 n=1 Tax=Aphelocoma coerulescens TaxID=39617 RepID=UPI003604A642
MEREFALSVRREKLQRKELLVPFFGRFFFLLETTPGSQSRFPCPARGRAVAALPRCCFEPSLRCSRAHPACPDPRGVPLLDTSRLPPRICVCACCSSLPFQPAVTDSPGSAAQRFVKPLFHPSPGSQGTRAACSPSSLRSAPCSRGGTIAPALLTGSRQRPCRLRAELHPRGKGPTAEKAGTGLVMKILHRIQLRMSLCNCELTTSIDRTAAVCIYHIKSSFFTFHQPNYIHSWSKTQQIIGKLSFQFCPVFAFYVGYQNK